LLTWRERAAGNYMRVVAQGRGRVVGVDDMIVVTAERLANVHRAARVLELKREFVAGPPRAALPILAALGGVAVPAVIYVLVNLNVADGALGAGPSRLPPTSPSRWLCWQSSPPTYRRASHVPAHPRRGR